jgi:hypothetical protein
MKIKNIIILLIFLVTSNLFCQNTKLEYGIYNIGLGSVVGGVGAIINKKPNEKTGKVLLKGIYQGALGGAVVYQSKLLIGKIAEKQSLEYSWYASLTNSIGNSFIENATLNKNFYEQINFNIGFNRFEIYPTNNFHLKYKVMPISLILSAYVATKSKFESKISLETGQLVFSSTKFKTLVTDYRAFTIGNVIVYDSRLIGDTSTFSHEMIHVLQYYDYNFVNSLSKKTIDNLFINSKFYKQASKFVYSDFQAPVLYLLYQSQYKSGSQYYENFYEREAGIYSNTIERQK